MYPVGRLLGGPPGLLGGAPVRAPVDDPQRVPEGGAVHRSRLVGFSVLVSAAQLARDVTPRVAVYPLADQQAAVAATAAFRRFRQPGETAAQQRQLEVGRVADRLRGDQVHDRWNSTARVAFLRRSASQNPGPQKRANLFIPSYPFLNDTASIELVQGRYAVHVFQP